MIALIHIEVDRDQTMLKPARNVGVQCEYVLNYRKEKIIIILAQYHYINKQINHVLSLFVASINLRYFSRGSMIILTLDDPTHKVREAKLFLTSLCSTAS